MRRLLLLFLLLSGRALAEPHVLRALVPLPPTSNEKKPVTATLKGKLFDISVRAFVVDRNIVRVRVELVDRVGPAAFYSVHAAVFTEGGQLLAGMGHNDVYHERKKGRHDVEQFDMMIPVTQLKKLDFLSVVCYEDSVFVGKR